MNEHVALAAELANEMAPLIDDAETTRQIIDAANITEQDRDVVRSGLVEIAEFIRKRYNLKIPVIRSFLHEMLDVSV